MNPKILVQFLSLVLALFPLSARSEVVEINELSFLEINSAITPATLDYLSATFERIPEDSLVIIKLNTPGGLVTTTKDIITLIGGSKNPVAIWVTPEGASAASAGSIIASAAHFILMSPGTSMGAATPVGLGEDLKESDGRKKAMSDLKSLVRALSSERNRPSAPFEEMIEEASSFTDKEASKLNIADIISDGSEITTLLRGRKIKVLGKDLEIQFNVKAVQKIYDPTPGQKLFEVLANPTTAYFLFLIAIALIYFEFQAPGGYVAGAVGTCLLVIAGMSFQVLPLDWGAFSLILIGIVLLVAEIYVTSYGLLFLAGLSFFAIGSLFLFQDQSGFISVHYGAMYSLLAGLLLTVGGFTWFLLREKKKNSGPENFFLPENSSGVVLGKKEGTYQVRVKGEIWNAISQDVLELEEHVTVTNIDTQKLLIEVKKKSSH